MRRGDMSHFVPKRKKVPKHDILAFLDYLTAVADYFFVIAKAKSLFLDSICKFLKNFR